MRGCGKHRTFVGALSQLVVVRGFCCLCQLLKSRSYLRSIVTDVEQDQGFPASRQRLR